MTDPAGESTGGLFQEIDAVSEIADPLHSSSRPESHWTTANMGEAIPGVATPLSATVWGDSVHKGLVTGAHALGAISTAERDVFLRFEPRLIALFHGRAAVDANFLALLGDRMPGTTGKQVVLDLFGHVPPTMTFHPTSRRYPIVAVSFPRTFLTHPRRVRELVDEYHRWWADSICRLARGEAIAARTLAEAAVRMERAMIAQAVAVMTCVQPVYEALANLVNAAGVDGFAVLSAPAGGAERAVVEDLWDASRGRLGVEDVAARHGFHGPNEGELSARVWREDPVVLKRLVDQYRSRDETAAPAVKEAELAQQRDRYERDLLAAVGPLRRPGAKAVLALARSRIPLRGLAKRSMLQSLDVARAAARTIGADLTARGALDDPEDVFYLTLREAVTPPPDTRDLAAYRRKIHAEHARVEVPDLWRGDVDSAISVREPAPARSEEFEVVEGVGVSPGVVEGIVRVVTDPTFVDVEPDEVLVAPTTDPSWCSIMFVSAALVVDIGGALSHAAVVARELGIPCVVNTRSGSRTLRTGDRVRVDGTTGRIEILERG